MNDLILTLAIHFLPAQDAFAASCVSSQWRAALSADRDNRALWRQVCSNSYPVMFAGLPRDEDDNNGMNYRLLTLGLWRGIMPNQPPPPPFRSSYTPTLRYDDIFAVVDLHRTIEVSGGKRRKEVIGSWVCPIAFPNLVEKEMGANDKKFALNVTNAFSQGEEKYSEVRTWGGTLFGFSFMTGVGYEYEFGQLHHSGLGILHVTVTLFRRDTMKSVRIMDGVGVQDWDRLDEGTFDEDPYFDCDNVALALSDEGMAARSMMYDHNYSSGIGLTARPQFTLVPKLPAEGSPEEPQWLVNCRREGDNYWPDEEDKAALLKIPYFEYEVKRIFVDFAAADANGYCQFRDPDDMMIALEGLCWE